MVEQKILVESLISYFASYVENEGHIDLIVSKRLTWLFRTALSTRPAAALAIRALKGRRPLIAQCPSFLVGNVTVDASLDATLIICMSISLCHSTDIIGP